MYYVLHCILLLLLLARTVGQDARTDLNRSLWFRWPSFCKLRLTHPPPHISRLTVPRPWVQIRLTKSELSPAWPPFIVRCCLVFVYARLLSLGLSLLRGASAHLRSLRPPVFWFRPPFLFVRPSDSS
jgi:hypothetical protein